MNAFLSHYRRYGVILFLWAGLLLQGAKTPIPFFIWSCLILGFLLTSGRNVVQGLSLQNYWKELLLALCLALSQIFAIIPSVTFYYTMQCYLFLFVWISLKADPRWVPDTDDLILNLTVMALLCAAVSIPQLIQGIRYGQYYKAYGLLPVNPIFNAAWISCVATLLFTRLLEKQTFKHNRLLAWGSVIILLGISIILPARSSVLALGIGLLYAGYRLITARRLILALLACLVTLLIVPNRWVQARLRLGEGNHRMSLWTVALQGVSDHPFTGSGLGNFEMVYQRHAFSVDTDPVYFSRTTQFAHNEYLQIAADVGIVAFGVVCAGLLGLLGTPVVPFRRGLRPAKAALIVLVVLSFYNIIWHLPLLVFLTLILSRLVCTPQTESLHVRSINPIPRRLFVSGIWVLIVSFGWFAMRSYWATQKQWEKIIQINPRDAEAWAASGDAVNDVHQAIENYSHATAIAPRNPYFHESLAMALEASQQPQNYLLAIDEYEKALRLSPHRAYDALAIGRILFLKSDMLLAREWFKKALHIEPHYWECDLWIARSLLRTGEAANAVRVLRNLIARREFYEVWRQRVYEDLPIPPIPPSHYEQVLLSYDNDVVHRELWLAEHSR